MRVPLRIIYKEFYNALHNPLLLALVFFPSAIIVVLYATGYLAWAVDITYSNNKILGFDYFIQSDFSLLSFLVMLITVMIINTEKKKAIFTLPYTRHQLYLARISLIVLLSIINWSIFYLSFSILSLVSADINHPDICRMALGFYASTTFFIFLNALRQFFLKPVLFCFYCFLLWVLLLLLSSKPIALFLISKYLFVSQTEDLCNDNVRTFFTVTVPIWGVISYMAGYIGYKRYTEI